MRYQGIRQPGLNFRVKVAALLLAEVSRIKTTCISYFNNRKDANIDSVT